MKRSIALAFFVSFFVFVTTASAAPNLTIQSPTNGTSYDTYGVQFNVTSDEVADFYTLSKKGRRHYIAYNTTSYHAMLYQKAGDYEFTIHANSSSGEGNATVYYSSTVHNPIEITECGFIQSSDTKYVLVNNISSPYCFMMEEISNISLDLNGFSINGEGEAFGASLAEQVLVKNGTISSDFIAIYMEGVNNFILRDLNILTGYLGYYAEGYANALFDSDVFRKTDSEESGMALVLYCDGGNVHIKDTIIEGIEDIVYTPYSEYAVPTFYNTFENATILIPEGNEEFNVLCLELSQCNLAFIDSDYSSASFYADEYSKTIVTEHSRLDVLTTDQEGYGVPSALEIDSLSDFEYNPTRRVLSSTESSGLGKVYLSNKLSVYESGIDNLVNEESYPSYNVTAYSGTLSDSSEVTFTSPAQVNFTFTFPAAADYVLIDSCTELSSENDYRLSQNISADSDPCIVADDVEEVVLDLDGFEIQGNRNTIISIDNSLDVELMNGKLNNYSNGISSKNSSILTFRDLEITDGSTGILLEQVSDSFIRDNSIGYNDIGINMSSSEDITLIENNLFNNIENVLIDPSEDIVFIKNFMQAASIGLRLIDIINTVFIGDVISDNNESVILENSTNIDFIRSAINSTTYDFVSTDSVSSVSNVYFDTSKTKYYGESLLYGYFPPSCLLIEEPSGEEYYECNRTILSDMNSSLRVSKGSLCDIKNQANIYGDIVVEGGILDIKENSFIYGDIINGSDSYISIKGYSTIDGDIATENSNEVFIVDANITGSITSENTETLVIKASDILGSITSTNDTDVIIKDNDVGQNIAITNSGSCNEKNNNVGGTNSGCP